MPTYEYECGNCGYKFERFQGITAGALRKCPQCGKPTLKRLIGSGSGVIFKGSGFYETDYRSDSYKKAVEKEKAPAKTEDKKTGKKTKKDTKDTKDTKDKKESA